MAKDRTRFVCQACGAPHPKWQGRCDACGEWNTLVEEVAEALDISPAPVKRHWTVARAWLHKELTGA